jgi:hypothetical protein
MTVRPIDGDALKNQIRHIPRTINPDLVQYSLVQAIIADMPTLTPPNEWVSVYDRLPEPGERVLATDCGFVGEFYINKLPRVAGRSYCAEMRRSSQNQKGKAIEFPRALYLAVSLV